MSRDGRRALPESGVVGIEEDEYEDHESLDDDNLSLAGSLAGVFCSDDASQESRCSCCISICIDA